MASSRRRPGGTLDHGRRAIRGSGRSGSDSCAKGVREARRNEGPPTLQGGKGERRIDCPARIRTWNLASKERCDAISPRGRPSEPGFSLPPDRSRSVRWLGDPGVMPPMRWAGRSRGSPPRKRREIYRFPAARSIPTRRAGPVFQRPGAPGGEAGFRNFLLDARQIGACGEDTEDGRTAPREQRDVGTVLYEGA